MTYEQYKANKPSARMATVVLARPGAKDLYRLPKTRLRAILEETRGPISFVPDKLTLINAILNDQKSSGQTQ